MLQPRVLMLDIETAPLLGYHWGLWKQNIGYGQLESEWYILCWAAKWLGDKKVHAHGLDAGKIAKSDSDVKDAELLEPLWELMDEADIIVAHNGKKFDMPKINARFLKAGFNPPSPYKQVDTLNECKKTFRFTSNRLDAVAQFLGLGRKMDTGGFDLWTDYMKGSKAAQKKMLKYNIQDVKLLEDVYLKLLPWMPNHPNVGVYVDHDKPICPKCGSTHLQKRGYAYTQVGKYHRMQCMGCGGWSRTRFTINTKEVRKELVTNA